MLIYLYSVDKPVVVIRLYEHYYSFIQSSEILFFHTVKSDPPFGGGEEAQLGLAWLGERGRKWKMYGGHVTDERGGEGDHKS